MRVRARARVGERVRARARVRVWARARVRVRARARVWVGAHVKALLLGLVGSDVLKGGLVARADEVERGHRRDTELRAELLGFVLRLEGTVEVLAVDGRLGARHVACGRGRGQG